MDGCANNQMGPIMQFCHNGCKEGRINLDLNKY